MTRNAARTPGASLISLALALALLAPVAAFADSPPPTTPVAPAGSPDVATTQTVTVGSARTSGAAPTSAAVTPASSTACSAQPHLQFRTASVNAISFFECTKPSLVAGLMELERYQHGIGWILVESDSNNGMYPATTASPGVLMVNWTGCTSGSVWENWTQWDAVTPDGVIPTQITVVTGQC